MATSLASYRAVLFDVDGTIAETEGQGHLPAFNQAFKEFGIPWKWSNSDYGELLKVTGGLERMVAYAEMIGSDLPDSDQGMATFRELHQRKNAIYAQRLESGLIPPRQGFIELVQKIIDSGQQWAVVTTTSLANWQALWRYSISPVANLPPPTIAICAEDVIKKKPDPQAYMVAIDRLNLAAHQCVAIEDSRNGLLAAAGAGVGSVIVKSQFFGHQRFPEAITVVNELSELL